MLLHGAVLVLLLLVAQKGAHVLAYAGASWSCG